jgi:hypothetical protein
MTPIDAFESLAKKAIATLSPMQRVIAMPLIAALIEVLRYLEKKR